MEKQSCKFLKIAVLSLTATLLLILNPSALADSSFKAHVVSASSTQTTTDQPAHQGLPKEFTDFLLTVFLASLAVSFTRYVLRIHLK
ncbi:hypothetical protein G7B40_039980 [Aetokthonos hydrillicola Thurmond2011]|jgi:hypothetical protein|uniref:Uncharacterized protein n=1 Tax=Aetokthonos hydrillicola Thurmond2011 TaxID=2712845 RepID=A0AAP5IFA9_9CYAN|nr:hypothetical protein [Aetokthonos hydrillicola]MBW4590098.1 hypothetical protein [Aetokthonos hydrillicola CCALA 1050]MDR9900671.1 hypothetical protein [Aetokthonos hydrillicola Thurmond2011]